MKFVNESDERFDVGLFAKDYVGGLMIVWSSVINPGDSASCTPHDSESGKYRVDASNILYGGGHIVANDKNATVIITMDANNQVVLKIKN